MYEGVMLLTDLDVRQRRISRYSSLKTVMVDPILPIVGEMAITPRDKSIGY